MMGKLIWIVRLCALVFLLGFTDATARDNDNHDEVVCADNWVKIHRGCYMFVLFAASWDDALVECKKQNGDLLSIQSEKEKAEMEKYFKTTSLTEKHWWVGLKRDKKDWKWQDGLDVNPQITLWIHNLKKDNPKFECGMLDVTRALRISSDRCNSELQYICEFHSITKRPSINHTTPVTPSRGATIPDDAVDKGVGDHAAENRTMLAVTKPGQKTTITGGLYSSVMMLSSKNAPIPPRAEVSKDNGVDSKTSTTVSYSETVTDPITVKEHIQEASQGGKTLISDTNVDSSRATTEKYSPPKTEFFSESSTDNNLSSKLEKLSESKSEMSSASNSAISPAYSTEKSPAPTETLHASTSVHRGVDLDGTTTTFGRSKSASSIEPTPPASTNLPKIPLDTPQPTMVDWARAYSELEDCYVPSTGGSMSSVVMTARKVYTHGRTSCPKLEIGGIEWSNATAGENITRRCPTSEGFATFQCGSKPVCWIGRPNTSACASQQLQDVLKKLEKLGSHESSTPLSVNKTVELSSNLAELVETGATTMADVVLTADVITALSKMKATGESVGRTRAVMILDNLMTTGSILVSKNKKPMWAAMSKGDKAQSLSLLLLALETAVVSIADAVDEPTVITKKDVNIEMEIRVVKVDELGGETTHLVYGGEQSDDTFSIPVETLKRFSKGDLIKAVFITHYSMSRLWNDSPKKRQPDAQNLTVDNYEEATNGHENGGADKTTEREIVSHIVSASLGKDKHGVLKFAKPVSFTLKHLEEIDTMYTPLCSFWDTKHSKAFGFWSQEGCRLVRTNKTHTTCQCDHMTNFAILMDVHGMQMSKIHQSLLRLVSIIGCIISCVSLLASWITFQCFNSLQGERNSIHKNLAMTLLIAEIIFVFGIDQARYQIACSVIAGFLHFFFLAAFVWMFIEGLHIIFMLVQVFDASRSRLPYYYLAGYGVPLAVVGASCLINYKGYGTDKYCWLTTDDYFVWAFAGPVAIILLVNAIFLIYALSTVCRHSEYVFNAKEKSNGSGIRAWVQGALALEVLLGLTWTLGYFLINDDSLPLAYVFAILNSLQGLFIFVFHCLLNKKAQKEYRQVVYKVVKRSPSSVTTQSTLTKRTNNTNHSHELNNSPSNSHQKLNTTNSHSQA